VGKKEKKRPTRFGNWSSIMVLMLLQEPVTSY
jgi:hypothetical protein